MGWVSMNEDIQEIRNQREHFRNGLANIIQRLKKDQPRQDLARSEIEIKTITDRLILLLEETHERVLLVFDDAEKRLQDPQVQIVKRLDKKDNELRAIKAKALELETDLSKCRSRREFLDNEIKKLSMENEKLRSENKRIKDNELPWATETKGISPLKKR